MGATTKGYPYPDAGDANNVPADLQALADAVDAAPGIASLTQAQIDGLSVGHKTANLHVYNSTTGRVQRWTGSAWVNLVEEGQAASGLIVLESVLEVTGTTHTLAVGNASKTIETTNASPVTITVPNDANIPVGFVVTILQAGTGQVTIAASGVTVSSRFGLKLSGQWAAAMLRKRGTTNWVAVGSLTA